MNGISGKPGAVHANWRIIDKGQESVGNTLMKILVLQGFWPEDLLVKASRPVINGG